MGEYAELRIQGFACEECGMQIDGEEPGYPRKCDECEPEK